MKITAILFLLGLVTAFVNANEESLLETANEFKASEKELIKSLEKAKQVIIQTWGKENAAKPMKNLTEAHAAWVKWRDLEAELVAFEESGGGHIHSESVYYQQTLMNISRAKTLRGQQTPQAKVSLPNGEEDYAHQIGNALVDAKWSIYKGRLNSKVAAGILALEWLPNKQVRGFFYPENDIVEYRLYGYNDEDGKIRVQIFNGKKLVCSGDLKKEKVNNQLSWAGNLASEGNLFKAAFTKITSDPSEVSSKSNYTINDGLPGDRFDITWFKNDTLSATITGGVEENEWTYFNGINYRKGYMFIQESGHFGDNEGLIGARMLLQKQTINGVLIWRGFRYTHDGSIKLVSIQR